MVNQMEELNRIHRERIRSLNISQNKTTQQYKSRSDAAKPQGELKYEIYDLYYDNNSTITTALDTTPPGGIINDPENTNYNQESIFEEIERNAPFLCVANDAPLGGGTLYVLSTHSGTGHFSRERPIYPQQFKVYYNVFELRLRSAVQGLPYRVFEYYAEAII